MVALSAKASVVDTDLPVTITFYEETDALYAEDANGDVQQAERSETAQLSMDETISTLTWSGKAYRYESPSEVRALVAAVSRSAGTAAAETPEPSVSRSAPPTAAEARSKALSAGSLLEVLGWIYGALAILGGVALALQEDSFGDRPFAAVGVALAFAGLVVATLLVALGRFIAAWVRTADEQAGA